MQYLVNAVLLLYLYFALLCCIFLKPDVWKGRLNAHRVGAFRGGGRKGLFPPRELQNESLLMALYRRKRKAHNRMSNFLTAHTGGKMGALQRPQNNNSAVEGQSITRVIAGSSDSDPPSNARSEKGRRSQTCTVKAYTKRTRSYNT